MQLLYPFIRGKCTQSFGERDNKVRTALKQTNDNNDKKCKNLNSSKNSNFSVASVLRRA